MLALMHVAIAASGTGPVHAAKPLDVVAHAFFQRKTRLEAEVLVRPRNIVDRVIVRA